jgi:hypothetical protein
MNFDDLVNIVMEMKSHKGEECLICHFPIDLDLLIKLKCNHSYHNNCINTLIKNKIISITCPYCQTVTNNPTQSNPTQSNPTNLQHSSYIKLEVNKCKKIIKTGVNKGKECNIIQCKRHNKIEKVLCKEILMSGKKKGLPCDRTNCKYHNNINLDV